MSKHPLIAQLEARARAALNLKELCFSIANDSYGLLNFRQALVFAGDGKDGRLQTISGLARLAEDSPYLLWLKRIWPGLQPHFGGKPAWLMLKHLPDAPDEWREGWQEWWPEGVYALPLARRDGVILGWACFLLDSPPSDALHQATLQLSQSWSYSWEMLAGTPRRGLRSRWRAMSRTRRTLVLCCLLLIPLIPVRQSILAPAEVVALDATLVTSPMDGVVETIHVQPNEAVQAGQLLFSLDDTVLRNRLAVLTQSVAVADAELQASTQRAFDDMRSKAELSLLSGRAHERRAELEAVRAQLERVKVRAEHEGIAVFADADDYLGRPVSTGERIMKLANPDSAGVLIEVPVADALILDTGADVKLFLTVRPLSPLRASVFESSYQATLSDEQVASYRLKAEFIETESHARIGLRGTAKVYGQWTVLGYYLLRRPFARLREWTGW